MKGVADGSEGSVIYLLKDINSMLKIDRIKAAQRYALELKLPLAVVATVSQTKLNETSKSFAVIESKLKAYKVPLIVLIGEPGQVLPGFYHHVKPRQVFSDQDEFGEAGELVIHPYDWPGTVIPVAELVEIVKNQDSSCI